MSNSNSLPEARISVPRPEPSAFVRTSRPVDDVQRNQFENALSRRSRQSDDEEESVDPNAFDARSVLPKHDPLPSLDEEEPSAENVTDALGLLNQRGGAGDMQIATPEAPPPVLQVATPQQAQMYAHMAMPLVQGADAMSFEVVDSTGSSLVSNIQLNTLPHGGLTVAIGTSVQNASLMDRYLPQLQRRLAEKASAHMRVEESDAERDGTPD